MFRIVALLLFAVLLVPGALHVPLLWSVVVAAPAWFLWVFRYEERRIRATIRKELRGAVERLPE